jgi:glycyl-tRNA synthetase beta chain
MRLLTDRSLPLPLDWLLDLAFSAFEPGMSDSAHADLRAFMLDRLGGMLREQGYSAQEVEAVLAKRSLSVDLVPRQLAAVRAFAALPEAASLAAANKRITNILAKSGSDRAAAVNDGLFSDSAEHELYAALNKVRPLANACFGAGDYTGSLRELAALKSPVDAYFDQVMVNADDLALRANRLALLGELHAAMNRVADLSKLAA